MRAGGRNRGHAGNHPLRAPVLLCTVDAAIDRAPMPISAADHRVGKLTAAGHAEPAVGGIRVAATRAAASR
jgi:hypothetical protein